MRRMARGGVVCLPVGAAVAFVCGPAIVADHFDAQWAGAAWLVLIALILFGAVAWELGA